MCLPFRDLAERTLGNGEHKGFKWEIVSNRMGFRCGYVRVLPGHPWFGKSYNDIDADVHGGLTFTEHGSDCKDHQGKDEWWVGFDCAHSGDAPDPALRMDNPVSAILGSGMGYGTVKSQRYVERECRSLAEQAATIAQGNHDR